MPSIFTLRGVVLAALAILILILASPCTKEVKAGATCFFIAFTFMSTGFVASRKMREQGALVPDHLSEAEEASPEPRKAFAYADWCGSSLPRKLSTCILTSDSVIANEKKRRTAAGSSSSSSIENRAPSAERADQLSNR